MRNQKFIFLSVLISLLVGCSQRYPAASYQKSDPEVTTSCIESVSAPTGRYREEVAGFAEPNSVLTLPDALALTLMRNPELNVYSYEIRAAEARHLQAGLWQNPELDVEVENFGGSGNRRRFNSAQTTIQLSQLIELGGKIDKSRQMFTYDSQLAQAKYDAKRLDVSTALTKTFIELLFIQEKERFSQELVNLSQEVVDSVDKRVQAGKDSPIDLSKAKIRLARAKLQDIEVTKYKEVVREKLASYWGSRNPKFTSAAGQLSQINDLPKFADVQAFLRNNPELIQRAIEVQKRQAEIALAEAKSVPDLTIAGGVKYFDDTDSSALVMGLSIPLPISDRNQGGRLEAVQNLRKAQSQEKVSALSVWNQVNRSYADLDTAYIKASILRDSVVAVSQELFQRSKIAYEQGKKDYLELLDSQRTYFAAKNEYIDILAKYHICKTELERLIGQNLQEISTTVK